MPQILGFPKVPSLAVGGMQFTDLDNLICLTAQITGASGAYATFRSGFTSSGYRPAVGKSFYAYALKVAVNSNAAQANAVHLGYGDTDVGMSSASLPTNNVWTAGQVNQFVLSMNNNPTGIYEAALKLVIPAQKYPYFSLQAASSTYITVAWLFGYEK